MRNTVLLIIVMLALSDRSEARTWRPKGQAIVQGDLIDVQGDNVRIRTRTSIETIAYANLPRSDQAAVKSSLMSAGLPDEASRLSRLEKGKQGSAPSMPDQEPEAETTARTWHDINGNALVGEFVSVQGAQVQLRVNGALQSFPVAGFIAADQQFISDQSGEGQDVPSSNAGTMPQGFPGMMPTPSMSSQAGEMISPGATYPGMMSSSTGMSPGMNGPPGSSFPPTMTSGNMSSVNMPSGMNMPMTSDPNQHGEAVTPNSGMNMSGSTSPYSSTPFGPSGGNGYPGSGTGPAMPDMSPPPAYRPPELPSPPVFPGFSRFNDVLKCENCGAEFTESDGLKEGDECPKCSGGSSASSSGGTRFRSSRGLVKGVIMIIALAAGGVGWIVKKVKG